MNTANHPTNHVALTKALGPDYPEPRRDEDVSPRLPDSNPIRSPKGGIPEILSKGSSAARNSIANMPDTAKYAHFLVHGTSEVLITRLLLPKHPALLSRAKTRLTAKVWTTISPESTRVIFETLRTSHPLPSGCQWYFAFARDVATPAR